MITHKVDQDLFSSKIRCVSSCSIDKKLNAATSNLTVETLKLYQERVERKFLISLIKDLKNQRYENITRSSVGITSMQLLVFDKLERILSMLSDTPYKFVLQKINSEILLILNDLKPYVISRFYENYNLKLKKIEDFVNLKLHEFESSEPQKSEANLQGLFRK